MHWTDWGAAGFWSVTRHADILDLNRQTDLLSSARGIRMEDQTHEDYLARRTFQETDPPDHSQTRIKVAKAFSKPVIAGFEGQIAALCTESLDEAAGKGTTRHSIAAGIHALMHQPGLLEDIRSGAVDDTMADEIIRRATPTLYSAEPRRGISTCTGAGCGRGTRCFAGSPRPTATRRRLTRRSGWILAARPTGT